MLIYTFTDVQYGEMSGTPSGTLYYRLRIVDTDGSFALSRIECRARASDLNVYPNPVASGGMITVEAREAIREVSVRDGSSGKILVPVKTKGSNKAVLSTGKLMPGLYLLRITTDRETLNRKRFVE